MTNATSPANRRTSSFHASSSRSILALTSVGRSQSAMSAAMSSPPCRLVVRAAAGPPGFAPGPEPRTGSTQPLQDPHRLAVTRDRLAEIVQHLHRGAGLDLLLVADPRDRAGDLGCGERSAAPERPRIPAERVGGRVENRRLRPADVGRPDA